MAQPRWIDKQALLLLHGESLAQHGGAGGLRDEGLLDSALARPRNRFLHAQPDLRELAAAYAAGIIRNHPFIDGNKRAGLLCAGLFLALNGQRLVASQAEMTAAVFALAAGELQEPAFAEWLRRRLAPR